MKKFHITDEYTLINFDAFSCDTEAEIIDSAPFAKVLAMFIKKMQIENDILLQKFTQENTQKFLDMYKMLLVYEPKTISKMSADLRFVNEYKTELYEITEKFYDFWRHFQRFGLMRATQSDSQNAKRLNLIHKADVFNEKVLSVYRTVSQKLLGEHYIVYRQLPAGVNANILYLNHSFCDEQKYTNLQNIGFVTSIVARPPFIFYTKSNTREGIFRELNNNPIDELSINKLHYFVFPIKVGNVLAFIYIHRDFLHHGVGLANLFEFAKPSEFQERKPDLVYVFGIREKQFDGTFYHDKETQIYFGFVDRSAKNDYFGYLKKMILTLHNVYQLDHNNLPVHGGMVQIMLKDDTVKNVVIIGDSGAGKSETLEALRVIGDNVIKKMTVVFDDMGVLKLTQNKIKAIGTEIGAFVRLDDLDAGYAYQEMERAIFVNPHRRNARVIIPLSAHKEIVKEYEVDLLLYANNYEQNEKGIKVLASVEVALPVFKAGKRYAKGTTSEVGLVSSYFANPFGPVQRIAQTELLLQKYFAKLYENKVIVGELYTKLANSGFETSGPLEAARHLLKYITKN